ncbi:MAG: hypothetical protein AAGE52_01805 [Myxococcota bacterium]
MRFFVGLVLISLLACGDDDGGGGADGGRVDAGGSDAGGSDGGRTDAGGSDAGAVGCDAPGACVPGEERRSSEGCDAGDRLLRCDDECVFVPTGACETEACDTPGETITASCGRCGSRTRFCTAERIWEDSECTDEGMCMPGTSRMGPCGNCGMETQRCTTECVWEGSGACSDEGECAPGATRSVSDVCDPGEVRVDTCSAACAFEAGECAGLPGLGEACPGDECEPSLVCDRSTGTPVCRATCTGDDDCSGGGCFTAAMSGVQICSDACRLFTNDGCPEGTKCDLLRTASAGFPLGVGEARICSGIGTEEEGGFCRANADCGQNLTCTIDDSGAGTCIAICNEDNPCEGDVTCDTGSGENGFCREPFFPFP